MNETIFYFFYNLAHQGFLADRLIVFWANFFPFIVVFLAGIFLLKRTEGSFTFSLVDLYKKYKEFLSVFFSSFLAYFFSVLLKNFFHTARPFLILPDVQALFLENSHAFPSGHTAFFSALAFALFFINKKVGYVFIGFALIIGIARIMAGVHFPIDILGGFVLGTGVSYLVAYFTRKE